MSTAPRFNFVRLMPAFAVASVVVVFLLRMLSPSDIHDQTQPKTVAYTTNIVLNLASAERWILPLEIEEYPATKPPLYNWVAAPFVALTAGHYEWAHKAPSILSFLAINLILLSLLKKIDPGRPATRYSAVMIFSTNYMWFKLSYLARPDSLLTLFLMIGWVAATMLVQERANVKLRGRWGAIFWASTALALLVKGPAAILIPFFLWGLLWSWNDPQPAKSQPEGQRASFRSRLQPGFLWLCSKEMVSLSRGWLGLPLALVPFGVWLFVAYQINPAHVYNVLIREEVVDRMLGIGNEGTKEGSWDLIRTLPNMPFIFLSRFFPWSIFFVMGMVEFCRRTRKNTSPDRADGSEELTPSTQLWLRSCLVGVILPILIFSFSAGKRGDYIAISFVPAALFVAWTLNHLNDKWAAERPELISALAATTLLGLAVYAFYFDFAVRYPVGQALSDFAAEVRPLMENADAPDQQSVEFYRTGRNPLQTLLHQSRLSDPRAAAEAASAGIPFWLFVRQRDLEDLRREPWAGAASFDEIARSQPTASGKSGRLVEVILYSVNPRP